MMKKIKNYYRLRDSTLVASHVLAMLSKRFEKLKTQENLTEKDKRILIKKFIQGLKLPDGKEKIGS
jgi:hypothetical protein